MCTLWHVWLYLKVRTVVLKLLFSSDVLLTVHLSIILAVDQFNAQIVFL